GDCARLNLECYYRHNGPVINQAKQMDLSQQELKPSTGLFASRYIPQQSSVMRKHPPEDGSGKRASNDGEFQNGRPSALDLATTGRNDKTLDTSYMIAHDLQRKDSPVILLKHEVLPATETLDAILSLIPVNTIVSAKLGEA
ncbi:hypothetical protein LTR72_011968, partial [Exophiala xenobiotica]